MANKTVEKEEKNVVMFKEKPEDSKKGKEIKRVAPQYIIENKLREFLADPEITIAAPEAIPTKDGWFEIVISSKNYHKITALAKTFKTKLDNVIFKFKYEDVDDDYTRTLTDVFAGNKHFDNIRTAYDAMSGFPVIITTFKDETIQYKADNRFVPDGYETTLMEDLVKDFFREDYKRSIYVTKEKSKINLFSILGLDNNNNSPELQ